jgi:glycosyltransferase involved in cell wall biosynthesis
MRFSIVTSSLNPGSYLYETLNSVITQAGDFSIQYHVQDAGSTDGTVELLKILMQEIERGNIAVQCREISFSYASAPDQSMYDGINRGFRTLNRHSSADLMLWINADDRLSPNALARVVDYFRSHPNVDWLIGRTMHIDEAGDTIVDEPPHKYRIKDIAAGYCDGVLLPYVTQEATVWRSKLWDQCGELNAQLQYAGDFEYWQRAAQLGFQIHSVDIKVGYHRKRKGQLSSIGCYADEVALILLNNSIG